MATSRQIVTDMRAHARQLDGTHVQGCMMGSTCRALRRGADEIERLLAELTWLRGFAETILEAETILVEDDA